MPFQIPPIAFNASATEKPLSPRIGSEAEMHSTNKDVNLLDFIPELHSTVINLYQRSTNFPTDTIPPFSLAESILRMSKLLSTVYLAGGWNQVALKHVVLGTRIPTNITCANYPPRAEIAAWAMRAHACHLESLSVGDKCQIYGGLASVLGSVNFQRRRALFLREIIKVLVPALVQVRMVGAAEKGIHPATGLVLATDKVMDSYGSDSSAESGLYLLLEDICATYGVPKRGDQSDIENIVLRAFGWSDLRNVVLRDCIAFCEALHDFNGVLQFTTRTLESFAAQLTKEDQLKLVSNIPKGLDAARRLSRSISEVTYWDPYIVRNISVTLFEI